MKNFILAVKAMAVEEKILGITGQASLFLYHLRNNKPLLFCLADSEWLTLGRLLKRFDQNLTPTDCVRAIEFWKGVRRKREEDYNPDDQSTWAGERLFPLPISTYHQWASDFYCREHHIEGYKVKSVAFLGDAPFFLRERCIGVIWYKDYESGKTKITINY